MCASFKTVKRLAALKAYDDKAHWEAAKNADRTMLYCMKEETRIEGPYEFGIKPVKRDSKVDWEEVKKNAEEGKF